MKAVVQDRFGSAETLEVAEVPVPVLDATSVLVRVRAASVNALDYRMMTGTPRIGRLLFGMGLTRPKRRVRGVDVAGVVEAVAAGVTQFRAGDEVFGLASGSFAEQAAADVAELSLKPPTLSFETAAALPVAGITALQAVKEKAGLRAGQSVLVIGAGGGVGTFAIQIARALGAHVTAATSAAHLDAVRALGAEEVVDLAGEGYVGRTGQFDVVIDIRGDRPFRALRRLLRPGGRIVVVGGAGMGRFVGALLAQKIFRYPVQMFVAKVRPAGLAELAGMVAAGQVRPLIAKTYPLEATAEAMRLAASHQAQGKLVISLAG
jgi:NADPH:quinone reductase-like Zn-dependent oxidoreductase